jgi:hypothetical protein
VFEAILADEARAAYDGLTDEDRTEVDRIIRLLEINPWTDDATKFATYIGRWAAGVYDDDRWEVVYRIVDDRFIDVIGISRIEA